MINTFKKKVSDNNRLKKYKLAASFIKDNNKVIDIGIDPSLNDNINYFEKLYDLKNELTCIGVFDDYSKFKAHFPNYKLIQFDGFNFPAFLTPFDFAFSNAVIEHVGNYDNQLNWLTSISKLTKTLFITTPNRWLPYEIHSNTFFFHWLPDKMRNFFYRKMGKDYFTKDYMWLLTEKDFKLLLSQSGFEITHFYRNKFLFFTIDFVAICKSTRF